MYTEVELGKTLTYSRRLMVFLAVSGTDGRDGTAIIRHWKAKGAATGTPSAKYKEGVSRYGVSEVPPSHGRRQWVWKKDVVKGLEPETDERPGPHTVSIDQHGSIWCSCMAGSCKAPTCRHCDGTLALLDAGHFQTEPQGS
jgi:hypothetical protein